MKYILFMISDYADWQQMSADEAKAFDDGINAFNDELRQAGAWVSAEGLDDPSSARTVRFQDGRSALDSGTFATGAEQIGGYWVIEADSVEAAAAWAERVPLRSGAIEVRHLLQA